MRIKEFTIKNFKNIGIHDPCTIIFPEVNNEGSSDFVTIIGENNIGKSSIFEALKLFLPDSGIANIPTIDMFPMKIEPLSLDEGIQISIVLNDFNDMDREHRFIKPYIYNGELKLRRKWQNSTQKDSDVPFQVYIPTRSIDGLNISETWNSRKFEGLSDEINSMYESFCLEQNITTGTIPAKKKPEFIEYVYYLDPTLVIEGEADWRDNPNGFASNIRSVLPKVIYVPAVKLIEDEADSTKTKSAANQITSALFEQHLNDTTEILNFKTALVELKNIFTGETRHAEVQNLENKISSKLNRLLNIEANVDFSTPEVMEKLHLNSNILLKYNNLVTHPNQQGNGVQRMLILSLLELMAEQLTQNTLEEIDNLVWKKSFIFMIEEPEIYLHPHLQRKMRDSLIQISKHSLAQVICTSHSENFINLADRHQGTVVLKRQEDSSSKVIQVTDNIYQGTLASEKRSRMRMLLNFNSTTLEAFFARRVVLVEGDCEIASIIAIKEKLKELCPEKSDILEVKLKEVSFISCNGKLTQKAYHEVLKHFGIQSYLVHDLDGELATAGNNLNILNAIGHEAYRLTHEPNFEKDIFGEEWSSDKPWKATKNIENSFLENKDKLLRFFKFVIGEDVFEEMGINITALQTTT